MLEIKESVSLKEFSTMRLGGKASFFVEITSEQQIPEAVAWAKEKNLKIIVIGDGSNVVWRDEGFAGLVLLNRILGFSIKETSEGSVLTAAAGEDWDGVVERTVNAGFSGIEQLSWIPGRVGAVPVQNVGAYGREIEEVLDTVRAYDVVEQKFVTFSADECDFGYRTSRFKTKDHGRFIITSISVRLSKNYLEPPFYQSLQDYLDEQGITDYSPKNIRQAVIAVRSKKLPDPDVVANNGSFFANPVVDSGKADAIKSDYPDLVTWPSGNGVKISAAWLIDKAGFKDFHDPETGMATWDKQSLVLINENADSTLDLINFRDRIVGAVEQKFGITLEQEPQIL